ncbi:KilA-N domain-containing protein [Chlorogloea sp. CCALA 695]|uniref:KilA-N domain-containing protein n=1 Tax=Chlorogloea sp. CCALA 695 TaxID=2107693 RepID=UPI000D05FDBA|nr:KilA-N domain-containing protein [Chlorogloea sp. CCALA 695]PSB27551.1 hypothetical protein C7B70_22245 [Chlorogloea sp. CCALA 695]
MNIILRSANGLQIGQRREDGYINATAMCVAYDKDLSKWLATDNTFELVAALAKRLGVQPKSPKKGNSAWTRVSVMYPTVVVVRRGSPENGGGTWIHYKLAVPLAMWISAEFALLVSDWVEYWLATHQNSVQERTSSNLLPTANAYLESSQMLNRVIHTAIHQQTNSLRSALKALESENSLTASTHQNLAEVEAEDINLDAEELKRGRPKGKRSHPDYEQVTAYIKKDTYQEIKISLLREGQKREFSELVQELLEDWLKSRT